MLKDVTQNKNGISIISVQRYNEALQIQRRLCLEI